MTISIPESELTFGPYKKSDVFWIEKSDLFKALGKGIKTVEFILWRDNKKMVYSSDTIPTATLEAVSSSADLLVFEGMMDNRLEGLANKVKHSTAKQAGKTVDTNDIPADLTLLY